MYLEELIKAVQPATQSIEWGRDGEDIYVKCILELRHEEGIIYLSADIGAVVFAVAQYFNLTDYTLEYILDMTCSVAIVEIHFPVDQLPFEVGDTAKFKLTGTPVYIRELRGKGMYTVGYGGNAGVIAYMSHSDLRRE